MQKKILVGAIASLAIFGAIAFFAMKTPFPAKAPGTPAPTLSGSDYVEHAPYYDITANYASSTPLLASAGTAADAAAVALMRKFVSDTIAQFKTDGTFTNLTPSDVQMRGLTGGRKEKLEIVYLIGSSSHTISYIFTIYEDTLGAHGNTFFKTFTFDTTTGAPLALQDVFTPGAPYLSTLSQVSRAKLPGIIGQYADTHFIQNGTGPDDKNFENFFFDNRDFVILFAPYAVAPYAAGPQTLRIPVSELVSILKPEYQ